MYLVCVVHGLQCVLEKSSNVRMGKNFFIRQGEFINGGIIFAVTGGAVGLTILKHGIPTLTALNFSNVYSVRAENSLSGVLSYIVFWFFFVILPMMLIYSIRKKNVKNFIMFCCFAICCGILAV